MDKLLAGAGVATILAYLSIFVLLVYGWIMNIINLIQGTYIETSTIIIGFIGVFMAPIGALVHFIAG